ncbi:DUF899 family protein [Verrucosispora sp. WMMD1129]|uniref:DUF899 family protein n=1 Tax=Verrucosispora sp. WMMD1129 TaxID=3016093 RepID=UPI00249B85DB|nr:DUF899 family protein [Verrucosispora sp. WMMD1129]WFE43603.1 DUF899 family protein [Verrucosispora sp. WMMD1129]
MSQADPATAPPSWPVGADEAYAAARRGLADAEQELRDQVERVAAARRALPPGPLLDDYRFAEGPTDLDRAEPIREVRLRELFDGHPTLFLYHLMFAPDATEACPMCSMWVDGFHGVLPHLLRHTAVAVVAKAPLPRLRAWARSRGWAGLRIVSSHGTSFNADVRAEYPDGTQRPMVSVLRAEGERVRHLYSAPASFPDGGERGIDLLSPVWNVLDLLPTGRGDWYAGNDYVAEPGAGRSAPR